MCVCGLIMPNRGGRGVREGKGSNFSSFLRCTCAYVYLKSWTMFKCLKKNEKKKICKRMMCEENHHEQCTIPKSCQAASRTGPEELRKEGKRLVGEDGSSLVILLLLFKYLKYK